MFVNYLPIPLTLLSNSTGMQSVRIAPEAFAVASAEFPDQIDVWQNALPGELRGNLASVSCALVELFVRTHNMQSQLSGAEILLINGEPPFESVDANSLITGGYQAFGTRQNS